MVLTPALLQHVVKPGLATVNAVVVGRSESHFVFEVADPGVGRTSEWVMALLGHSPRQFGGGRHTTNTTLPNQGRQRLPPTNAALRRQVYVLPRSNTPMPPKDD